MKREAGREGKMNKRDKRGRNNGVSVLNKADGRYGTEERDKRERKDFAT